MYNSNLLFELLAKCISLVFFGFRVDHLWSDFTAAAIDIPYSGLFATRALSADRMHPKLCHVTIFDQYEQLEIQCEL